MNDQQNGQPASPAAPVMGPEAQKQVIENVTKGIRPIVQTMCQGMLVGWQGAVPPHVLFQLISFELGFYLGYALNIPDIAGRVQMRNMFMKAFEDGLKKAPLGPSNWSPPPDEKING